MNLYEDRFEVRFSVDSAELKASKQLRYKVFIEEMGGKIKEGKIESKIEEDQFDQYCKHLLIIDHKKKFGNSRGNIVGVIRLMLESEAKGGLGFCSSKEYNLRPLVTQKKKYLELGRTCIDVSYRNSLVLHYLWKGLGCFSKENDIDFLFGVASFPGNDVKQISMALSFIHNNYLAPVEIRPKALRNGFINMDIVPENKIDKLKALREMPSLLKGYWRLGAMAGEGAFMDKILNTIDVCILIDVLNMTEKYKNYYGK